MSKKLLAVLMLVLSMLGGCAVIPLHSDTAKILAVETVWTPAEERVDLVLGPTIGTQPKEQQRRMARKAKLTLLTSDGQIKTAVFPFQYFYVGDYIQITMMGEDILQH